MDKNIKGVIFDIGGVLLKNDFAFVSHVSNLLEVSEERIESVAESEWDALQRGEETSVEYWHRVCKKLGVEPPANSVLSTIWGTSLQEGASVNKETVLIVEKLAKQFQMGIISNTEKENCEFLHSQPFMKFFTEVLLSPEVGLRKPESEIFELAASRLGLKKSGVLFIDDDEKWVEAARNYGMEAIHFISADRLNRDLKERGII